jgi:alpha-glucosidase
MCVKMVKFELVLLLVVILGISDIQSKTVVSKSSENDNSGTDDENWWKKSIFYQIYPRSFKDSDGNGIGDLKGIIEKLEHLKDAGVGAVWLSPIFESPMVDMGYDIKDYYNVDPVFGSNQDLLDLLDKAHELGLKLILDLVPNHTSDKHEWFEKSVAKDPYYKDFYIWDAGIANPEDPDELHPPNNWLSVFSGSAWTWHDGRGEFYLHQFFKEQPDLNFRNEDVKNAMFDVLKHYVSLGFDGFRIDAINYLFEDEDLTDELPLDPPVTSDQMAHEYLNHEYTKDLEENYGIVAEWRKWIDEYNALHPEETPKVLLTEAYSDFDLNLKWYGDEETPIAHIPFNFDLITDVDATTDVVQIKTIIDKRINAIPSFGVPNWVLGNHDNSRVGSRYTKEQIDGLNMLVLTLPGIAVTYYGEEIGMVDYDGLFLNNERDPERTPFQWDGTLNSGFSTFTPTWLPVHPDYASNNLALQKSAPISYYKTFQMLSQLRQMDEFVHGNFVSYAENDVLLYKRFIVSHEGYAVAINFGSKKQTVPFSKLNPPLAPSAIVVAASQGSTRQHGLVIDPLNLELEPYEAIVFSYKSSPSTDPPSEKPDPDWWKKTVFYQIYPRSFKDSDADGIGDLQGIIENLDHFVDAGIGAVWLSPVFSSPMKDFGYDISDFYDVDPMFGTKNDLINLLTEARKLGIKVLLDFVPNHTSDQHVWFTKSVNREGIFTDYYVWHDGIPVAGQDQPNPPNNWLSVFSGSAWTWNSRRKQYYLHQFTPEQPDLNFRNPLVREEMFNIVKYWVEVGFDGFRVDAINHMFEDEDLSKDEPILDPAETTNPNEYEYLEHKYTRDLDETYHVVREWREWIDAYSQAHPELPTKILLTEVYANFDLTMRWYGSKEEPISHVPFNFDFIMDVESDTTVQQIKTIVDYKIANVPEFGLPNWVMGNHDRNRVASRFSPDQVDAFNILAMTLPGIAVTYYGEEIGMEDNQDISWDETVDPRACQTNDPVNYKKLSRDPVRTPFQWNDKRHAGFSLNLTDTWLPVHDNYLDLNLAAQKVATTSHYKVYQALTKLRQNPEFLVGSYKSLAVSTTFNYIRKSSGGKTYGIAINFAAQAVAINLTPLLENEGFSSPVGTIEISSVNSNKLKGSEYDLDSLSLGGYEAIIFEIGSFGTKLTISFALLIAVILRNFI